MAKKKEVYKPPPSPVDWTPAMIEARRNQLFPNVPPPTLKQIKAMRNKTKQNE